MADLFVTLAEHPLFARLLSGMGLPAPVRLARASGPFEATPLTGKTVLLGAAPRGHATAALRAALESAGAVVLSAAPAGGVDIDVIVFDGTGIRTPAEHRALYDCFHPLVRRIGRNGRVLIVVSSPEHVDDAIAAAAARGIEGFVRALAKEVGRHGAQANLLYVEPGAADRCEGPVRYFCTERSVYVDGQAVCVGNTVRAPRSLPFVATLRGRIALVTGAARGIGAATARRLAAEGARVVCVDMPKSEESLAALARSIDGDAMTLDITSAEAPARLDERVRRHGGVDVVIHNAGITRDKTLARMTPEQWDAVARVNLASIAAIDEQLLASAALRDEGRIVCLSSLTGIAGNVGQTNYATSKAALIGYVAARAPRLASRGICINAVAPGFIETPMTEAMPLLRREVARRMNSLGQGGMPEDVAELAAFLASPGAYGITGSTIRICGQAWVGA